MFFKRISACACELYNLAQALATSAPKEKINDILVFACENLRQVYPRASGDLSKPHINGGVFYYY